MIIYIYIYIFSRGSGDFLSAEGPLRLSCFIYSWWAMFSHLGLSLLDQSEESDPMASVDPPSVILAQIFFVAFLILGVVLLINMLIALLSSTYQKTEVRT